MSGRSKTLLWMIAMTLISQPLWAATVAVSQAVSDQYYQVEVPELCRIIATDASAQERTMAAFRLGPQRWEGPAWAMSSQAPECPQASPSRRQSPGVAGGRGTRCGSDGAVGRRGDAGRTF